MSFENQSTQNKHLLKISVQDAKQPITNNSTLEVKNVLGSSEVSIDRESYALSLEMLTSQIEHKKQQLKSQQNSSPV
jgi:hypothetical protein